ncbi:hypothetical protein LINPERHAP1_LOCUS27930 [Linum perenne]
MNTFTPSLRQSAFSNRLLKLPYLQDETAKLPNRRARISYHHHFPPSPPLLLLIKDPIRSSRLHPPAKFLTPHPPPPPSSHDSSTRSASQISRWCLGRALVMGRTFARNRPSSPQSTSSRSSASLSPSPSQTKSTLLASLLRRLEQNRHCRLSPLPSQTKSRLRFRQRRTVRQRTRRKGKNWIGK